MTSTVYFVHPYIIQGRNVRTYDFTIYFQKTRNVRVIYDCLRFSKSRSLMWQYTAEYLHYNMITITVLRPQNRSALLDLKSYTGDVHKSSPIFHFHSQKTKTQLKTNAHTPRGSPKIKIKSAVLFCGRNTSLKSVKLHWKYGFLTRVSWQVHHRAIEDLKQQSSCVFNTVVQSFSFIGICSFLQADISHVRNRPPINI